MKKFNFKNTWFAVAALFAMSLTTVAFTSCSDDDDDKEKISTGIANNTVSFNGIQVPIEKVIANHDNEQEGWRFLFLSNSQIPLIKKPGSSLKKKPEYELHEVIVVDISDHFLGKTHQILDIPFWKDENGSWFTYFTLNGNTIDVSEIKEGSIFAEVNMKKQHLQLQTKFTTKLGDVIIINCNSTAMIFSNNSLK